MPLKGLWCVFAITVGWITDGSPVERRKNEMMRSNTRSNMGPGNHKDGSHNGADTRSRRVHPKNKNPLLQESDVTRIPTTPHWQAMSVEQAPIWQYESPDYEVESSIPSLSLVVPEIPTHSSIEEIDTRPALPVEQASPVRAGAPFYAPNGSIAQYVDVPIGGKAEEAPNKEARAKKAARLQVANALEMYRSPKKIPAKRRSRGRNPLEHVRWWLLYPGRIEFVLWLCGTVLLIGVTCMLLLVTAFSFEWIAPGQQSGMALQNLVNNPGSSTKPVLTVIDPGPFSPGQVIRIHGEGFSVDGRIVFTFDSTALQLSQNVASGLLHQQHVNADGHGEFFVSLTLGNGPAWKAGRHSIVAHDLATNHLAFLSILLVPSRKTPTPVSSTRAGNQNGSVQATPIATIPPPAKSTPAPAPRPTATPTQTRPTPTPTATPSPTATATPTPVVKTR